MEPFLHKDHVSFSRQPYQRPRLSYLLNKDNYSANYSRAQEKGTWNFKGTILPRIAHAKRNPSTSYGDCFDCETRVGFLHLFGCALEECPQCGDKVMLCECHICDLDPVFDCRKHARNPNRTVFFLKDVLWANRLSIRNNEPRLPYFLRDDRATESTKGPRWW